MLKESLIFIGGAATGAAVCYFVVKKKVEDEANRRVDEEIASTKAYYATLQYSPLTEEEEAYLENDRKEVEETYDKYAGRIDYSSLSKKPDLNSIVKEKYPEYSIEIIDPNQDDPEELLYEQQTLQYYEGDGVLADISENIISDVSATIGDEALDHFGEFGEEDVVRVRNKRLGTDYEVIRIHSRYVDLN